MSMKSFGQFTLALTLAVGLSTAAFAYETPKTPITAPDTVAAHAMKTKEECEKMPTAERTECMKHIKDTKAEATTATHDMEHKGTHKAH